MLSASEDCIIPGSWHESPGDLLRLVQFVNKFNRFIIKVYDFFSLKKCVCVYSIHKFLLRFFICIFNGNWCCNGIVFLTFLIVFNIIFLF